MPRTIEYFFSLASPWAYIGHRIFTEIAQRHGLSVDCKPVFLGRVFAETGGLPLAQRHAARQRYRLVELQRWRDRRGLTFALHPKHSPFDPTLADRLAIALAAAHRDPLPYLDQAFPAVWEAERNLADPATLGALLREIGHDDPEPLLESAGGTLTEALYALNLERALELGVFGAPAYVLDGEVFWGQDRLELLDDALSSGRPPYRAA
jgi:2-hydroxychromene-2-carboxylate isomerase